MNSNKYSSYTAKIYKADDDAVIAEMISEKMEAKFPGADCVFVNGSPSGQCFHVDGDDQAICDQIRDWINSNR